MATATLMIQGTTSDAGKSTLVTGLCRLLHRRGVRVAPFKPQNMAQPEGAVSEDGQVIGSYLNGLFDSAPACDCLLEWAELNWTSGALSPFWGNLGTRQRRTHAMTLLARLTSAIMAE